MQFRELEVARLRPSPLNPRKHFDEGKLQELAASFAGAGIIEPLVVRPINPGEDFEIVAGARRYRAAQLAQLETVPVIVRQLTDTQVLEIMVIENNQREDVNALEEGEGFHQLLQTGYDLDKLAERIGRSRKYIYDRMKLRELVPEAKTFLLGNRLTAGHAILLARLKAEDQERAIDPVMGGAFRNEHALLHPDRAAAPAGDVLDDMTPVSVRELEAWIDKHVRFEKHQVDTELLPETAATLAAAAMEREKVIQITYDHHVRPDVKEGNQERIYGPQSWKRADGTKGYDLYSARVKTRQECDRSITGVVVIGPERGAAFKVCIDKACDVHWKDERKPAEKKTTGGREKARQSREEADRRWKEQQQRQEAERQAWEALRPKAFAAFAAHVKAQKVTADLVRELLEDYELKRVEQFTGKVTDANVGQVLAVACVQAYNRQAFLESVKPFKFNLGVVEQGEKRKSGPVQTSAQKKPAAKPKAKGKKR